MADTSANFQFSEVLHALREAELYKLPRDKIFLSAGCSGAWYFEWVGKACRPSRHIGVELFSPRPSQLPENAEWIAASIGSFPEIPSDSIDIVFSGQNIEHLWADDVIGFLLESRRVLKSTGMLAVDTPNRAITSPMNWTHPEHTAEFTTDELHRMFAMAGFAVVSTVGHWHCRDGDSGETYPLVPTDERSRELVVAERVSRGLSTPTDSFSVWVNGVVAGEADEAELRRYVHDVWRRSNAERMSRFTVSPQCTLVGGEATASATAAGFLMWGPYVPLLGGSYLATWQIRLDRPSKGVLATLDVISNAGHDLKAEHVVHARDLRLGQWLDVVVDFDLPETTFGLEFRLNAAGGHDFSMRRPVVTERAAFTA